MKVIEWLDARYRVLLGAVTAVCALALTMTPSWATDPVVLDFDGIATAGKDGVLGAVNSFMPIVVLLFAAMIGLGLTIRFFKRAAKSS